jgi:hypothetical protein
MILFPTAVVFPFCVWTKESQHDSHTFKRKTHREFGLSTQSCSVFRTHTKIAVLFHTRIEHIDYNDSMTSHRLFVRPFKNHASDRSRESANREHTGRHARRRRERVEEEEEEEEEEKKRRGPERESKKSAVLYA